MFAWRPPALLLLGALAPSLRCQATAPAASAAEHPLLRNDPVPAASRASADRGLRFVLAAQNRDGSWGDEPGMAGDVGNTAFAALALLATNNTPTRGEHAFALRRAVDWLMLKTRGFDSSPPSFRMGTLLQRKLGENADLYLVCVCYSQLVGMNVDGTDDTRMRGELSGMCRSIAALQKSNGVWETSYEPMLTTVLAWLSLQQSAAVGVTIEHASPQKALEYLRKDCLEKGTGVFREAHWGNNERFVTQAGGLRVFYGMGIDDTDDAQRATQVVLRMRFDQDVGGAQGGEEFLGALFATQALFLQHRGPWEQWQPKIARALLACQNADGSWNGHHCITGRVFCTSASVMTLLMPDRLLPMGER
jgi:hypothetical protein